MRIGYAGYLRSSESRSSESRDGRHDQAMYIQDGNARVVIVTAQLDHAVASMWAGFVAQNDLVDSLDAGSGPVVAGGRWTAMCDGTELILSVVVERRMLNDALLAHRRLSLGAAGSAPVGGTTRVGTESPAAALAIAIALGAPVSVGPGLEARPDFGGAQGLAKDLGPEWSEDGNAGADDGDAGFSARPDDQVDGVANGFHVDPLHVGDANDARHGSTR